MASLLPPREEHPAVPWSLSVQSPGAASGSCGWNSRGREGADQEASCRDADVSVYLSPAGAGTRLSCLLSWAFPWFLGASLLKPFPPPTGPLLGVPSPLCSPGPPPFSLFPECLSSGQKAAFLPGTFLPPWPHVATPPPGIKPPGPLTVVTLLRPAHSCPAPPRCPFPPGSPKSGDTCTPRWSQVLFRRQVLVDEASPVPHPRGY